MSDEGQADERAGRGSGRSGIVAGALFPLGTALRVERALLARRPEVRTGQPRFRGHEIDHWRPRLAASPTLGALVDAIYDEARARAESAVTSALSTLATTTILTGLLVIAIALPAVGQMFDVSPWLLVAAGYALLGQIAALRGVRLGRFLRVGIDALEQPIDRAQKSHGEQSRDVLLVEARACRAVAADHDRALSEAIEAFVGAASASLRNASVAIAVWILLNAVPQSLAAAWRGSWVSFGG